MKIMLQNISYLAAFCFYIRFVKHKLPTSTIKPRFLLHIAWMEECNIVTFEFSSQSKSKDEGEVGYMPVWVYFISMCIQYQLSLSYPPSDRINQVKLGSESD